MLEELGKAGRYLGQAMRMMVGLPDYDAYLDHMERVHPDKPVMTYEEFFRDRMEARYEGKGKTGTCC